MRNYQRKKNNPYALPHNVYMQALYLVKDYKRLRECERDVIYSMPTGEAAVMTGPGDPTARKVERIDSISQRIRAVDSALSSIPSEYRKGVMQNITEGVRTPLYASESTWRRYRARLVFYVAEYMNWA